MASDPPALRTLRFYALPARLQQCVFECQIGSQPDDLNGAIDDETWRERLTGRGVSQSDTSRAFILW